MFLATANKSRQLVHFSLIGHITRDEFVRARADIVAILNEMYPGFLLLTDFARLESMSTDCAPEIAWAMEICDQKKIGRVIRIIPDSTKDIGLDILTLFHYKNRPPTITCQNILETAQYISQ